MNIAPHHPVNKLDIAVVGAGISGLGAALEISKWANVTLIEKEQRIGGHSHAVDVNLDGISHPVDTGFLVFNDKTYPNLIRLFEEHQVPTSSTDMSFAMSLGPHQYEWCGADDLSKAFAQPSNLFKPRFWRMLKDMGRFNTAATQLARQNNYQLNSTSLGDYLRTEGYSADFSNDYLLPMAAAIWSCPVSQILDFPMHTFVRFCDNHGLLQVNNRPKWRTVKGSSREYVSRLCQVLRDRGVKILQGEAVTSVSPGVSGPVLQLGDQSLSFDAVVLASHSDESLAMLGPQVPYQELRQVLSSVQYQPNRAVLHTDKRLMPKRRRAWAAWNYLADRVQIDNPSQERGLSVTYWLNQLQPLPFKTDVFVTLNPLFEPEKAAILHEQTYSHPIFDAKAISAQSRLPEIQGQGRVWLAGAWCGYGFHEDGLKSGLEAANSLFTQMGREGLLQAALKNAA